MLFQTTNALGFPLLSLAIFLPLLGAAVIAILPAKRDALYLAAGLFVSGIVLAIATILLVLYDPNWGTPLASLPRQAVFQFADPSTEPASWLPGGIGYQVAVDGIAVVLVFLTALLTFLALLFSLHRRPKFCVVASNVHILSKHEGPLFRFASKTSRGLYFHPRDLLKNKMGGII